MGDLKRYSVTVAEDKNGGLVDRREALAAIEAVHQEYGGSIEIRDQRIQTAEKVAKSFEKDLRQARDAIEETLRACGLDPFTVIEDVPRVVGDLVKGLKAAKAELLHRVEHLKREAARQCQ